MQEAAKEVTTNSLFSYRPEMVNVIIGLIIWYFKNQSDRRYQKQQEVTNKVYQNEKDIATNRLKDESDSKEFNSYKILIEEKNRVFKETFDKIDISIGELTKVTSELRVAVGELKAKI